MNSFQICSVQLILVLAILILIIVLFALFSKVNIVRNPFATGFSQVIENQDRRKFSPNDATKDALKRRRRGKDNPPVFPNGWIPLIPSSRVKKGQSQAVTALGQDMVVFRGREGKAFVLDAYCPHLGSNLGVGGKVRGNCIECPFHGWKFDGTSGICVDIPYSEKIPLAAKIRKWTTCELLDFIFVWHHAEGDNPSWEIPEIEEIVSKKWTLKGRTEHTALCHVQEVSENGADLFHFDQVHSNIFASGADIRYESNKFWSPFRHIWKANWSAGDAPNEHISYMNVETSISLFNTDLNIGNLVVNVQQIGPALVHLRFRKRYFEGAFVQFVTPEGPYQQRITQFFYCDWIIPPIVGRFYLSSESVQLERDIMLWNNKRYLKNPMLTKEEISLAKHRRWFSQFYSNNSPTLRDLEDQRIDW